MSNKHNKHNKHPFHKKFSFPINVAQIKSGAVDIDWFVKYQNLINEVYVPAIMFKLGYDAHNSEVIPSEDIKNIMFFLKQISEKTDIKLCIIFNDIFITEKEEDLKIEELKNYLNNEHYLKIDIIVVPSEKWLIFKSYNIIVKNTVLLQPSFTEIKSGLFDEYDMVYIHDEVVHNLERFKKIKEDRKFGCVVNFSDCRSDCPFKNQHYKDFRTYSGDAAQENIDSYCPANKDLHVINILKGNAIPRFYSSYLKYVDVLDIFKLQGRWELEAFDKITSCIIGKINISGSIALFLKICLNSFCTI